MQKQIQAGSLLLLLGLTFSVAGSQAAPITVFGHDLSEQSFGVVVDLNRPDRDPRVAANVLRDFTDPSNQEADSDPSINNKIFLAYVNQKGFELVYLSLMEHSESPPDPGEEPAPSFPLKQFNVTSPFQMLIEHFRSPQGRDVLVINSYEGLLAYSTPLTPLVQRGTALRPTDVILTGYTFSGQFLIDLLSRQLLPAANETYRWSAAPFLEYNSKENSYTFGITYSNVLVAWRRTRISSRSNETIYIPQAEELVALTLLDHLTFRHHLSFNEDSSRVQTEVTSTYDIGRIRILVLQANAREVTIAQVLLDNETLNGTVKVGSLQKARFILYTDEKAIARLRGVQGEKGFGLIILSSMNILSTARPGFRIDEGPVERSLATQNQNITHAVDVELIKERIFRTDFTRKPTYSLTLPNSTQIAGLPVFQATIGSDRIHLDQFQQTHHLTNFLLYRLTKWLSPVIRAQLRGNDVQIDRRINETGLDLQHSKVFLAIQFPVWGGLELIHDPVFIAFGRSVTHSLLLENLRYFVGMTLLVMVLIIVSKRRP
ncbi:MAG: hypothetical protein ACE5I5_07885 [Candidatus Heimdallarchaeota archaeon]